MPRSPQKHALEPPKHTQEHPRGTPDSTPDACLLSLLNTPEEHATNHLVTKSAVGSGGVRTRKKGLRDRNSPMCTLSQNGYGAP